MTKTLIFSHKTNEWKVKGFIVRFMTSRRCSGVCLLLYSNIKMFTDFVPTPTKVFITFYINLLSNRFIGFLNSWIWMLQLPHCQKQLVINQPKIILLYRGLRTAPTIPLTDWLTDSVVLLRCLLTLFIYSFLVVTSSGQSCSMLYV